MLLEFLQAVTGIFVVVYDGQHALKFTLGRAREVVGPGVHFKWPIVQRFAVQGTKHTTLDLEPQIVQLADDLIYEVETKVMYQIADLRRATIEIDDLVKGLQNRVVMIVQQVAQAQDRKSIREVDAMVARILAELRPVEEQWGVRILQLGFSNLSPSPATLEITQLEMLAQERLRRFRELRAQGLSDAAAVALVTGAVVATHPREPLAGMLEEQRALRKSEEALEQAAQDLERAERRKKPAGGPLRGPQGAGPAGEAGDAAAGDKGEGGEVGEDPGAKDVERP